MYIKAETWLWWQSPSSQSYGLSISRYGWESWTIKKAECQRIDAFELWCWRRLLRVSRTDRRSNQSILKEINPKYSLKDWCWSYNACITWCKEPNHWKRPWCWDRLKAGRDRDKGRDGWMASLTQWTWVQANSMIQWRTGKPGMLHSMGLQRMGHDCYWTTNGNTNKMWVVDPGRDE